MPDIGVYHPQIVHFVIGLLYVGVAFRVVGLLGRPKWMNSAATALIVLGTLASVGAVRSGLDAHGPVERIPGAREALDEHEEWGIRTRNAFLVVATIELLSLVFLKKPGAARIFRMGSAITGIIAGVVLFEAGEHGGHLVYKYAGGIGTRSGEPEDVSRLLIAGLSNKANQERRNGNAADAARLFAELARVHPDDPDLQLALAQSKFTDLHDAQGALDVLATLPPDPHVGRAMVAADAYEALGMPDSARAVLTRAIAAFPAARRLQGRLSQIK